MLESSIVMDSRLSGRNRQFDPTPILFANCSAISQPSSDISTPITLNPLHARKTDKPPLPEPASRIVISLGDLPVSFTASNSFRIASPLTFPPRCCPPLGKDVRFSSSYRRIYSSLLFVRDDHESAFFYIIHYDLLFLALVY